MRGRRVPYYIVPYIQSVLICCTLYAESQFFAQSTTSSGNFAHVGVGKRLGLEERTARIRRFIDIKVAAGYVHGEVELKTPDVVFWLVEEQCAARHSPPSILGGLQLRVLCCGGV